jgi:hypothetical protein
MKNGQSFEQIVLDRLEEQNCRSHPLQSHSADTPEHQIIKESWWVEFHFVLEGISFLQGWGKKHTSN